jgi:hypothetical protein
MLAALVLLAMFIFIGGDYLTSARRSAGGGRDPNSASFGRINGKSVTVGDAEALISERRLLIGVFARMRDIVGKAFNEPKFATLFGGRFRNPLETGDAVASLALLGKADELGIEANIDDATAFVKQTTANALNAQDFRLSLQPKVNAKKKKKNQESDGFDDREELSPGITESDFFRYLIREIRIRRALEAVTPGVEVTTAPLDVYRDMERGRTQIQLELARIPIDKQIDSKSEPSDQDLLPLYERYKSQPASTDGTGFGLLVPARAKAEYLSASVDKFVGKTSVTDAELQEYYKNNKYDFLEEEKPAVPPPPKMDGKGDPKKATPGVDAKAPAKSEPKAPAMSPAKEPEKGTPKAPAKADEGKSAPKAAEPKPAEKLEKKTSLREAGRALESLALVSLLAAGPGQNPPTKTEGAKESTPKAGTTKPEPPKADAAKSAGPKGDAPKTSTAAAKTPPAAPTPPATGAGKATPPSDLGKAKAEDGKPPEPKFKPYESVKGEIEKLVRKAKARTMIREQLEKIKNGELTAYADDYLVARRRFQQEQGAESTAKMTPPPQKKTMEQIAKESGFEYHKTDFVTEAEARKLPGIGESLPFGDAVGSSSVELFFPSIASDMQQNDYFLFWKTDAEPAKQPEFNVVRPRLAAEWRKIQAREPTKKVAEEFAEKVKKANGKFETALQGTGYVSFRPKSFTRDLMSFDVRTSSMRSSTPRTGLDGVPDAGEGFLNQVFELEEGDVVTIPGDAMENYYVVRVVERKPPEFKDFVPQYSINEMQRAFLSRDIRLDIRMNTYARQPGALAELGFEPALRQSASGRGGTPVEDAN